MMNQEQPGRLEGLKRPVPNYDSPYQSGITDPLWPLETPPEVSGEAYDDYRGRIDKQDNLTVMRANLHARDRDQLRRCLRLLTEIISENESKKPSTRHLRPLDYLRVPQTYRVTITLGFGPTLFVDRTGFDRYGIRALKPTFLKTMPRFPGDSPDFDSRASGSDLILLIASDSAYVNVAISRYLTEFFDRRYQESHGVGARLLEVLSVENGFARPDKREFLRFDDGIDNLRPGEGREMEHLVYVDPSNVEPEWCRDGSYLVYRKIREHMAVWELFLEKHFGGKDLQRIQEEIIGRHKKSGRPLSREVTGKDGMTPVYPDSKDPRDGPLNAHIRKVQPRRKEPDLFGIRDLERRFLRRPYPFFDGLNAQGEIVNGLHFMAFMQSIQQQFEHVTNMWQMNPHFPVPDTGMDALYAHGVISTIGGGYYFCPPAAAEGGYLGSGILEV